MNITYNIYRISTSNLSRLIQGLSKTELVKQKTKITNNFTSTFYFSENPIGHDVWWADAYKEYLIDNSSKPRNIFYYALLISEPKSLKAKHAYLVSLGKSHFYLNKFIDRDFGINLAVRIADEETILLKKSTYFSSVKTGELSSYIRFIKNNYDPGESVDHLKLKASKVDIWGDKNIIFSDSIQISSDIIPTDIEELLNRIEQHMSHNEVIHLPKLETVRDSLFRDELDGHLLTAIRKDQFEFSLSEFEVTGCNIRLESINFDYDIYIKDGRGPENTREKLGDSLNKNGVSEYIKKLDENIPLCDIKIKSTCDLMGRRTRALREVIEFSFQLHESQYILKRGIWYIFNNTFMQLLKKSLENISYSYRDNLYESEYQKWKSDKECEIKRNNSNTLNKILYREFFFNEKMCEKYNYELLDRKTENVESMTVTARDYKVEIADLYDKDKREAISVKISDDSSSLIYNIVQSLTSIELHINNSLSKDRKIETASLWFIFTQKVNKITEFNSIQFLLSLESWKKRMNAIGVKPNIYISQHIK